MTQIDTASERELDRLIQEAGERLLHYWPGTVVKHADKQLKIETKTDGSPVTCADIESNEILIKGLRELFPGDGIFSEELYNDPALSTQTRVWIIDPLDGTKSFVEGHDDFSILLSLCVNQSIEFSMMYFPARKKFARALRGRGATLDGVKLEVSKSDAFRERSIYLRHIPVPDEKCFYDAWMDAGLAFLSLCRGTLDGIVMRLIHHQEWDLAAPVLMIEESGGKVTDEFGNPLQFNKGPIRYGYLVASNGILHPQILKLISQ